MTGGDESMTSINLQHGNIPAEMRGYKSWVVWKGDKVPHNLRTGLPGNDISICVSFDEAIAAFKKGGYSGIGFILSAADPFACIDLDNPYKKKPDGSPKFENPEEILKWQDEVFERLKSWSEISQSGKGRHIWVLGAVPAGMNKGYIEIYSSGHFIVMTGNVCKETGIENRNNEINKLWVDCGGGVEVEVPCEDGPETYSDQEIIEKAGKTEFGQNFIALKEGNINGYPSPSEADQAFFNYLVLYSKSEKQLFRIYESSKLGQIPKKPLKGPRCKTRPDYVLKTIRNALKPLFPQIDFTELKKNLEAQMREKWNVLPTQCNIVTFDVISDSEWNYSRLHPQVIVENYLYADVAVLIASGGVGKTTLVIYEAIHIILGLPLYGRTVRKPGPVMIITAEDSREQIIARTAKIAARMNLFPEHIEKIKNNFYVLYVGNQDYKLCCMEKEMVANSVNVDKLIETIKPLNLSLLNIDPAVSFSVGESRVNDAEQGLIRAARRIKDALNCCVRYIHHTGKESAKKSDIGQYAGRGGSAMPDGARMVAVLKHAERAEWFKETGKELSENAEGLVLALPKLSFTTAQPNIYLERTGFAYEYMIPTGASDEKEWIKMENALIELLRSEEAKLPPKFHSKVSLDSFLKTLGMTQKQKRIALERLHVANRIAFTKVPGQRGQGQIIRLLDFSPANSNQ